MSTFIWRRRQDRLAALFPLFAVGLFAILTYWLDARVTESARAQKRSTQPAPDHFLQNFKILKDNIKFPLQKPEMMLLQK